MRRLPWSLPALLLCSTLYAATYTANSPRTTNNDDSCDVAPLPAATLLLPYFEVDIGAAAGQGETTLFTITNTFEQPQAARVTLWTDYALPVLSFNIYLTGYDVQSINLYDVIVRGRLAPDRGTGSDVSPVGELSRDYISQVAFDNPLLDEASCVNLAVQLPQVFITRMQQAFTRGVLPAVGSLPECRNIGGAHPNAIGYATIDVVGLCGNSLPVDAAYFASEIRYDNVLVGDYMQVNGAESYAQVNPLVHIRAVPEGGTRTTAAPTNLQRTFYSRLQPAASQTADRRQPLPAVFAARWIQGGPTAFETHYKVWREAKTAANAGCESYALNGAMIALDLVRFDEDENPETLAPDVIEDIFPINRPMFPATSLTKSDSDAHFPVNATEAVGGWFYFNFDDDARDTTARQNWVVVSMRAAGRFSGDLDAQALGNGCTAPLGETNATGGTRPIGPAPNETP